MERNSSLRFKDYVIYLRPDGNYDQALKFTHINPETNWCRDFILKVVRIEMIYNAFKFESPIIDPDDSVAFVVHLSTADTHFFPMYEYTKEDYEVIENAIKEHVLPINEYQNTIIFNIEIDFDYDLYLNRNRDRIILKASRDKDEYEDYKYQGPVGLKGYPLGSEPFSFKGNNIIDDYPQWEIEKFYSLGSKVSFCDDGFEYTSKEPGNRLRPDSDNDQNPWRLVWSRGIL